ALDAVLQAKGTIPFETIHTLRRPGGLPGHPTVDVPGVLFNTGSLGMGISKANGLVLADRLTPMFYPATGEIRPRQRKIHVLVGDGECEEGQFYESINHAQENVIVHIDSNGFALAHEIFPIHVNDSCKDIHVHKTVKGSGISFMEGRNEYHAGALNSMEYGQAIAELCSRLDKAGVRYEFAGKRPYDRPCEAFKLAREYPSILAAIGRDSRVLVMDADLEPDCGLKTFKSLYPDRFIQCGIAEQDMVSTATGLAAGGFIPIVHSFAAFLCRRANEQIYNACLEGRHIVFVGAMAGMLPTGPGTSHECLHDVELMKTMPGMTVLVPEDADQLDVAMRWAVMEATGPVYVSIRCWEMEGMRR
ncbi:MAG: hypothetical protein WC436_06785, partial [Candidatus Babeliales bacterium]